MAEFIPGKTYAYFDGCWPEDVQPAQELIGAVIEEEGPFDAVIGYSQGATIFLSYCLELPRNAPPPVKWALCIGPNMISSAKDDYKEAEIISFMNKMSEEDMADFHSQHINRKAGNRPETYKSLEKMTAREKEICLEILGETWLMLKARDFFHIEESEVYSHPTRSAENPSKRDVPRFINPIYSDERIKFPVVFAEGRNDSPASKDLQKIARRLVLPENMLSLQYDGIHEVPYKARDVENIVKHIEKASLIWGI